MKHSIDTDETTRALARAKSNSLGATARRHRVDDTALPMSAPSGEAGGSRLDRLIRLLDTGSSPEARREAARQIGELAASHANQLPNLLRRVRAHLRSKKWETRTAASATLSEISSRLKHPTVETLIKLESEEAAVKRKDGGGNEANANAPYGTGSDALDLTFAKFNVEAVLEKAGILLSSSGTSWHLEHGPGTKAERLAQARARCVRGDLLRYLSGPAVCLRSWSRHLCSVARRCPCRISGSCRLPLPSESSGRPSIWRLPPAP